MTEEEVRKQLKKLKREQTAGKDGIPNEACLKAPDNVIRRKTEIMNEVWMGENIPKQWSEGIICPIQIQEGRRELMSSSTHQEKVDEVSIRIKI